MSRPCRFETLAVHGCVSAQRCVDCGGISVHVGCVTVRLDAGSFELLARTVIDARRELARVDRGAAAVPTTRARGSA